MPGAGAGRALALVVGPAETVSSLLLGSYGHVPNGARVYYLQRSQPPLLTLMMARYVAHTNDAAFLRWAPPRAARGLPSPRPPQGGWEVRPA